MQHMGVCNLCFNLKYTNVLAFLRLICRSGYVEEYIWIGIGVDEYMCGSTPSDTMQLKMSEVQLFNCVIVQLLNCSIVQLFNCAIHLKRGSYVVDEPTPS